MKKDLIYSFTVLFIVVNGLLGLMTIGITELIKYSEDDAAKAARMTMNLDSDILGNIQLTGCSLSDNKGWIFVIFMLIGIIGLIAMNIYEHQQKKKFKKK